MRRVEVTRKLVDGPEVSARGDGSIISALEFLKYQLSKLGHRDLLVTAPYRDLPDAADRDQS